MRKIIQIAIEPRIYEGHNDDYPVSKCSYMYALCDDGSIWKLFLNDNSVWSREDIPPIPQDPKQELKPGNRRTHDHLVAYDQIQWVYPGDSGYEDAPYEEVVREPDKAAFCIPIKSP